MTFRLGDLVTPVAQTVFLRDTIYGGPPNKMVKLMPGQMLIVLQSVESVPHKSYATGKLVFNDIKVLTPDGTIGWLSEGVLGRVE